jgi:hypothetical protein
MPVNGKPSQVQESLMKLKSWSLKGKVNLLSKKRISNKVADIVQLRKSAKGEAAISVDQRVYVHVEAEAIAEDVAQPRGDYFFSKKWSVGKVLDQCSRYLAVRNVNNAKDTDDERLRIFHVEGGKLLPFNEHLGERVQDGDTIAIIRGLHMTNLIDLTEN